MLTILLLRRARRLRNDCTPYLVNVSVTDLVMTVTVLPMIGVQAVSGLVLVPFPFCKIFSALFHALVGELHWGC